MNLRMTKTYIVLCFITLVTPGVYSAAANPPSDITPTSVPTYKLRPGDRVSVLVVQEKKLSLKDVTIDANGELRLTALPQPLHFAGLSVAEAQAAAESGYKTSGVVANPRVSITVEQFAPKALTEEKSRTNSR